MREAWIGITVGELGKLLLPLAPDTIVVVPGRYGGLAAVSAIEPVALRPFVNGDPDFGPHEIAEATTSGALPAVVLRCHPARR